MDLPSALLELKSGDGLRLRFGTVSTTSPLTVVIAGGAAVTCRRLASYTPTGGHFVAVLVAQGSAPLVLGQVTS